MQDKFEGEISAMRSFFDNTLCAAHANARKAALKPQVFVQIHDEIIGLVLDKACVDRILGESGSWKNVHPDLNSVVASGQLGGRLFGFALDHVLAEVVRDTIEARIEKMFEGTDVISTKAIEEAKREASATIADMENIDGLPMRRQLALDYRGFEVPLKISSVGEEIDMRCAARVKAWACSAGDLDPLFCEDLLLDRSEKASGRFAPEVLKGMQTARSIANDSLNSETGRDGESIKAVLRNKEALLTSTDPSFKLEIALFTEMSGAAGERRLQLSFMKLLPTEDKRVGIEQAAQQATLMQKSELFDFVTKSAQGQFQAAQEMLCAMLQGREPAGKVGASATSWLSMVKVQLQYFCVESSAPKGNQKGQVKTLVGVPAIKEKFKRLTALSPEKLSLASLEPLHVFGWLLSSDERERVRDLTARVLAASEKDPKAARAKRGAGKASGSSTAASGGGKGKASSEVASAMAYFS